MQPKTRQTGNAGEDRARRYLEHAGYRIVTTNWHCQYGEIDIIAYDNAVWVFVEVKTRRAKTTEQAFASVTPSKREKLIRSAQLYLAEQELEEAFWRIDVIAIAFINGKQATIEHVKDALDW